MRKHIARVIVLILLFCVAFPQSLAEANTRVNVTINGRLVNFDGQGAVSVSGRTLVPIRGVFETLGFDVSWDGTLSRVTLLRSDAVILITLGESEFTTNGTLHHLDVPAQSMGGRVLLPIRAVLESVNYSLQWDARANTVRIETTFGTLPDRKLSSEEIGSWIDEYHLFGGALEFELEVIRLTNIERARVGAAPLSANENLMMAARFKSQEMHNLRYFAHSSPVYGSFYNISSELFGYDAMGENLATGHRTPEEVVNAWMNSPGHRENMLRSGFTEIGVGLVGSYWSQKFR